MLSLKESLTLKISNAVFKSCKLKIHKRGCAKRQYLSKNHKYFKIKFERIEMSNDENALQEQDYKEFFQDYENFSNKLKKKRKRHNDYNPILAIRSGREEVTLHSRLLHSFLDSSGLHYQDSLFLRLFLKQLKLDDFFVDAKQVRVRREYKHIDLYFTDGDKHLIIENKIYAGDMDTQISRYIETIKKDGAEYENIAVVYLNLEGKKEDDLKSSLGKWKIVDKEASQKTLENDKKERIHSFLNATYKEHILDWIEECQKEVKNITNLNMSLEFYKDCIEKLINGEEIMLRKILENNSEKNPKYIQIVAEIQKQRLEEISVEMFKQKFEQEYKNKDEFKDYEVIGKEEKITTKSKEYYILCHKNHRNQSFRYILTLENTNSNFYLGFRMLMGDKFDKKHSEIVLKLKKIIEESQDIKNIKINKWGWWLADERGETDFVDLTNETLDEYFERLYKKVEELNDFLGEQEKIENSPIYKLAQEVK